MAKRIILIASGNGSNVENICRFFEKDQKIFVVGVYTNNPKAKVIERVFRFGIKTKVFDKKAFTNGELISIIKKQKPHLIILAGFLWKIGSDWLNEFPYKIINIHPALLPRYGGKGMYGQNVHNAVKENKEKETGITIHYVNKDYDKGAIIFQKKISLTNNDSAVQIAKKVHDLEHRYFPSVIAKLLMEEPNEV